MGNKENDPPSTVRIDIPEICGRETVRKPAALQEEVKIDADDDVHRHGIKNLKPAQEPALSLDLKDLEKLCGTQKADSTNPAETIRREIGEIIHDLKSNPPGKDQDPEEERDAFEATVEIEILNGQPKNPHLGSITIPPATRTSVEIEAQIASLSHLHQPPMVTIEQALDPGYNPTDSSLAIEKIFGDLFKE